MTTPTRRLAAPPEVVADDPPVRDLMTHRLVAIVSEAGPDVALRLMASTGVRHLPVMANRGCVGMVAETDVLRGLAAGPVSVGDLVRAVPLLRPADPRTVAAARMHAARSDVAVVVDERDRLVGILTATDLIRSLAVEALPPSARAAVER